MIHVRSILKGKCLPLKPLGKISVFLCHQTHFYLHFCSFNPIEFKSAWHTILYFSYFCVLRILQESRNVGWSRNLWVAPPLVKQPLYTHLYSPIIHISKTLKRLDEARPELLAGPSTIALIIIKTIWYLLAAWCKVFRKLVSSGDEPEKHL